MQRTRRSLWSQTTTGTLLLAAWVVVLTVTSIGRAYAVTAVANALVTIRAVPAGAVSAGILLPALNTPIQIAATTASPSTLRGTADGAITRHQESGVNSISSSFVNAAGTTPTTLAVSSSTIGTDIAYLSPGGVNASNSLEIGPTVAEIRIENDEAVTTSTVVELMW